jgi:L-lactate dehydrogenase
MRTHEGNRPDSNIQLYDSERLLSAAARLTRIHDALLPYLKKCVEENARCGLPVMRPLFMLAPGEDRAYDHRLYSYLLGPSLLVAPVVEPGKDTRSVWLPEGEWVHLWTGKRYAGGEHTIPAPIGQPPVFRRADCADADITIIAIGKARAPGQTRLDLLGDSVRMAHELAGQLRQDGVGGLLISITNPCDIIAGCLRELLGLDRLRAFGTGTLLDTARLTRVLSGQTGAARRDIEACVLGEHGDSSMIPFSALRIAGRPASEAPGFDPGQALERTHGIGMDIIEGKGSTEFGIGEAAAFLIRVILTDEKTELPLSVSLEGEYGAEGVSCGVPCLVGRDGIEKIIGIDLNEDERKAFDCSLDVLKRYTETAKQYAQDE